MDDWQAVCKSTELESGAYKLVDLSGEWVAVYRIDDEFLAIEDVCSHDGGELAGGPVVGSSVECVRHGARFDLRTGAALNPPAYAAIACFPTRVEGGVVYVRDARFD